MTDDELSPYEVLCKIPEDKLTPHQRRYKEAFEEAIRTRTPVIVKNSCTYYRKDIAIIGKHEIVMMVWRVALPNGWIDSIECPADEVEDDVDKIQWISFSFEEEKKSDKSDTPNKEMKE